MQILKLFNYLVTYRSSQGLKLILNVPLHCSIFSNADNNSSPSIADSQSTPNRPSMNPHLEFDASLLAYLCQLWFHFARVLDRCPSEISSSASSTMTESSFLTESYAEAYFRKVLYIAVEISRIIDSTIDCMGLSNWNALLNGNGGDLCVLEAMIAHCWRFYGGHCHPQLLKELRRCPNLEAVNLALGDDEYGTTV